MTPIERGARALCKLDGHPENTLFEGKPMWTSYIDEATAVIRSMREPTEEMCEAASQLDHVAQSALTDGKLVWRAMIDVALHKTVGG